MLQVMEIYAYGHNAGIQVGEQPGGVTAEAI